MLEFTTTRHNPLIDPQLAVWSWEIPVYLFLGGVVADADEHVGTRRRQVPPEPLDEGVFSAFADGHSKPRCPPGMRTGWRRKRCPAVPCGEDR